LLDFLRIRRSTAYPASDRTIDGIPAPAQAPDFIEEFRREPSLARENRCSPIVAAQSARIAQRTLA
jgi:hypothetical protein